MGRKEEIHLSSNQNSSVLSPLKIRGFPHISVGKESAYNARNPGWIPGSGKCPGEGNGNPLQYSCLKTLMGRGA